MKPLTYQAIFLSLGLLLMGGGIALLLVSYTGVTEFLALVGLLAIMIGLYLGYWGRDAMNPSPGLPISIEEDFFPSRVKCQFCGTLQSPAEACVKCGAPLQGTRIEKKRQKLAEEFVNDRESREKKGRA